MEFLEAPVFTRNLPRYLDDESYRGLQNALADVPDLGDVMPGTGGFRKVRWTDSRRGKGRRGGLRVIYYWFDNRNQIWLMAIYDKDEALNLTPDQKKMLKDAIDAEKKSRSKR
jgi:mRNA-degrading endonuclease RelE of RelBE toxin-antitoxin system